MIYQIYYGTERPRKVLFDIEFYLCQSRDSLWYVELHSNAFISGALDFILDNLDKTKREDFKKDCDELEELRGWVWETHRNWPRRLEDTQNDKKDWGEYIEAKLSGFCDKYGLYLNID